MVKQFQKLLVCGESSIIVNESTFNEMAFPLWFKPHDNEQTAAQAVRNSLSINGGKFIEIVNGGERNISFELAGRHYVFDPNRMFSSEGVKKTLRNRSAFTKAAQDSVQQFAHALIPLLDISPERYLLTAHNNTQGWFSILSYKNKPYTLRYHRNKKRCIDDFYIVTTAQAFDFFASQNFNVAWENPAIMSDDGSLSAYAFRNHVPYINVEAMHGHLDEHYEMVDACMKFVNAGIY